MSHFTVLIIGNDVEKQLAPFHEFECTGTNDQYVVEVDQTAKAREAYEKREGDDKDMSFKDFVTDYYYGRETLTVGEKPDIDGPHKFGFIELDTEGEVLRVVDRTNPNKKWDWWVVGGRWRNMLHLKDGTQADSALKGDIDFEAMRNQAAVEATREFDRIRRATGGQTWKPWKTVLEENADNVDAARTAYHEQPAMRALREASIWVMNPDEYLLTREQFAQTARNNAYTTFAVLKDGQWYERGEMGWWGVITNETDRDVWNQKFQELIDGLPEDTQLTVVDCHI